MEYGLGEFSESEEKGINHSKPNLFLSLPVEAPAAFRGFSTSLLALLLLWLPAPQEAKESGT